MLPAQFERVNGAGSTKVSVLTCGPHMSVTEKIKRKARTGLRFRWASWAWLFRTRARRGEG